MVTEARSLAVLLAAVASGCIVDRPAVQAVERCLSDARTPLAKSASARARALIDADDGYWFWYSDDRRLYEQHLDIEGVPDAMPTELGGVDSFDGLRAVQTPDGRRHVIFERRIEGRRQAFLRSTGEADVQLTQEGGADPVLAVDGQGVLWGAWRRRRGIVQLARIVAGEIADISESMSDADFGQAIGIAFFEGPLLIIREDEDLIGLRPSDELLTETWRERPPAMWLSDDTARVAFDADAQHVAWFDGAALDVRGALDLSPQEKLPLAGVPDRLRFAASRQPFAVVDRNLVDIRSARTIVTDVDEAFLRRLGSGVLAAVFNADQQQVELVRDCAF